VGIGGARVEVGEPAQGAQLRLEIAALARRARLGLQGLAPRCVAAEQVLQHGAPG
jgi:hypothetical protein